jgi:hypothetical protein
VPFTHYFHIVGDSHARGRRTPAPLAIDPINGQLLRFVAAPSPTPPIGSIVRGNTSTSAGRVVRIVGPTEYIIEVIPNALGIPGFAFTQNSNLVGFPFTGETLTFDNGATAVLSPLGNGQTLPADEQFGKQLGAEWMVGTPTDLQSDTPYWSRTTRVARKVVVPAASATGTAPYFRRGDRCTTPSGAATVWLAASVGSNFELRVINVSGTLSPGQTLTNTTLGGGTTGTISTVATANPTGIWVPHYPLPNLGGDPTGLFFYEVPPNGNGGDGGAAGFGPEIRLLQRATAHYANEADPLNRGVRLVQHSSLDDAANDGFLGGVVVQVVKCSGTFPTSWTPGAAVTGGGGWSATVLGFNAAQKYLFVVAPNGATLAAGTITQGGTTATATGPALGWQKGSLHWNNWIAQITAAKAAPAGDGTNGALFSGQAAKDEGVLGMFWEGEVAVHANGSPFPTSDQARSEWVRWASSVRELMGADVPIALWLHRLESQANAVYVIPPSPSIPTGIPVSFLLLDWMRSLPAIVPKLTIVDSTTQGWRMDSNAPNLWLRPLDYVELGEAAWRHFKFGQLQVPPANGLELLPVLVLAGQSNATGFIGAGAAMSIDQEPELWPSATFAVGINSIDQNAVVWNTVTHQLEPFAVDVNANGSWGTTPGTCGPEVPIVSRMRHRFSTSSVDSARFGLFKFTVPGSCIQTTVPDATGCWDPDLASRVTVSATCNVTAIAASGSIPARGRFTATSGTPFLPSDFPTNLSCVITGSTAGVVGAGGNNTPQWGVSRVWAVDPGGTWVEFIGAHVPEGPRAFSVKLGPPPIWPVFADEWKRFEFACRDFGFIPVPFAIVWEQAESDLSYVATYKPAALRLWSRFEALIGKRLKGQEPIAKCLVLLHSQTGWPVDDATVAAMRTAQVEIAGALSNCVTVDPSDLPIEPAPGMAKRLSRLDNGLHHTGRGMLTKGFRIDATLATLGASKGIPPHPKGELAVDFGAVNGGTPEASAASGSFLTDRSVTGEEDPEGLRGASSLMATTTSQSVLDSIEEAFTAGGIDIAGYTVNGRTVQNRSLSELIALHRYITAQQQRAKGIRRTRARFH